MIFDDRLVVQLEKILLRIKLDKIARKFVKAYASLSILKDKKRVLLIAFLISIALQINVVLFYFFIGVALDIEVSLLYYSHDRADYAGGIVAALFDQRDWLEGGRLCVPAHRVGCGFSGCHCSFGAIILVDLDSVDLGGDHICIARDLICGVLM